MKFGMTPRVGLAGVGGKGWYGFVNEEHDNKETSSFFQYFFQYLKIRPLLSGLKINFFYLLAKFCKCL